jgi:hypothetical protein
MDDTLSQPPLLHSLFCRAASVAAAAHAFDLARQRGTRGTLSLD